MKTSNWRNTTQRISGMLVVLAAIPFHGDAALYGVASDQEPQTRPNNINPAGSYLAPPSFASGYSLSFYQNFAAMTSDAQIMVDQSGKDSIGDGAWWGNIGGQAPCIPPSGHDTPYGIDDSSLVIRMQRNYAEGSWWDGWTTGELWSVDQTGAGFAQKFGYFEVSLRVPDGNDTWPAFWLVDGNPPDKAPAYAAEIDIEESGSGPTGDPNSYTITCHGWPTKETFTNMPHTSVDSGVIKKPGLMTTGFHTYGADVEPDGITFYFDRKPVWFNPSYPAVTQPLAMRLSLAMVNEGKEATSPTDLRSKYVAVWASPNSPNYKGNAASAPGQLTAKKESSSKINLTWNAVSGATSYNIYRSAVPSGESKTPFATGIASTSYSDTGLAAGQEYYYTVAALNSNGIGATSTEVSATTSSSKDALPAGWTGDASYDNSSGTFTLSTEAVAPWERSSPLEFVSRSVSGNQETIIAEVAVPPFSIWSNGSFPLFPGWFTQPAQLETGITFRDAADSKSDLVDAPYIWLGYSLNSKFNQGLLLMYRKAHDKHPTLASYETHVAQVFPYWLKLVKIGNRFTGYYAYATSGGELPANDQWIKLGSHTLGFTRQTYLGGLQVVSGAKFGGGSATFTHVSISPDPQSREAK